MSKRFGKTPSDSALSSGFEDNLLFQGNIDQEQIIRLQLNRCNVIGSTGDDAALGFAVMMLLPNIPPQKRMEIEDMKEAYEDTVDELVFEKASNGWRAGTVEHPVKYNGQMSPRMEPRTYTNWHRLLTIITLKLYEAGLGIPMQRQEIITGEQWDPNEETEEEEAEDDSGTITTTDTTKSAA